MNCTFCNGTGKDAAKTAEALKKRWLDRGSYIRCWMCNGNGLEPPYPSSK